MSTTRRTFLATGAACRRHREAAALERDVEQPQCRRKEAVRNDHARVLKARGRRAAEHEDDRGEDRAGRMPPQPPGDADDAEPADHEMAEDRDVEGLHGGVRHHQREKHHARREQ